MRHPCAYEESDEGIPPNASTLSESRLERRSPQRLRHTSEEPAMEMLRRFTLAAVFGAICLSTVAAAAAAPPARITVLYDAFGSDPAMVKDWGYAALVEID